MSHPLRSESDHPQLSLFGGAANDNVQRKTTRAENKKVSSVDGRLRLPLLAIKNQFTPRAGVPATRADCPDTTSSPCPHIRCRHHLFLEEASTRAGRPGLRSVERDERGWTVSQPGDVGKERAGTTVNPRWLRIQDEPAEAERCCPAWLWFDDNGQPEVNVDPVRWDHMGVRTGDALDIINRMSDLRVTWARVANDNSIALEEMPAWGESMFVWIVRKRLVQSCALDVAARGAATNEEVGRCIGRHRTLVARVVRRALRTGCERAEEAGMEREDFVGAVMKMGSEKREA